MRIIHTSDWHLGQDIQDYSRIEEQSLFLDWLLNTCLERQIDALLVAGDIYDSFNPSLQAQELLGRFLVNFKLRLPLAQVVVVAGNHDSGMRLELPRPFAQALGNIHLVGNLHHDDPDLLQKAVIPLFDAQGKTSAWCLAVPFLRIADVGCKVREGETLQEASERSVASLYQRLREHAQSQDATLPIIVMGHLTLTSSQVSKSERPLIGGLQSLSHQALSTGADYVALGHIHRAQKVGAEQVRYSGSPLAMDIDERSYQHQVLQIDLHQAGELPSIESIAVAQQVEFMRIPAKGGSWNDLEQAFSQVDWESIASRPAGLWPFVQFRLAANEPVADVARRVAELCRQKPLRFIGTEREPSTSKPLHLSSRPQRVDLRGSEAPLHLLRKTWERSHNGHDIPDSIQALFLEAEQMVRLERGNS
jgi:DNA repair protein SbcD/Mre11